MPALTLFGRTWRVGSDDFVFSGLFDLLISLVWLVASVIIYWKNDPYMDCSGNDKMKLYIYGVFATLHLVIITSAALVHYSKAGSIMDTEARRYVPHCLYLRLLLQAFSVAWNILGTIWAFQGTLSCPGAPEVVNLAFGFIICNWILVLLELVGIFIVFDPVGSSGSHKKRSSGAPNMIGNAMDSVEFSRLKSHENARLWSRRLRGYCLSPFSTSKSTKWALHEAGVLLGSSFTNIDLVPTDVFAALILLTLRNRDANRDESKLQESLPASEKSPIISQPTEWVPLVELLAKDWRHPRLLTHFLKFGMASYTWPIVLFDGKSNSVGRLYKHAFLCPCLPGRKHPLSVKVIGDGCCFCRTAGVRHITGLNDEDFVVLSFDNKVYGNPFFVAKDDTTKSIVITIRGTMSMDDVLTDLSGWPTPIGVPGLPESFKAHNGMLISANRIKAKLEELKIIPDLLNEYSDYSIIATGTSLGAGVATLLTTMLRVQYPRMKCYAFAPPGGLCTKDFAEYTTDYVTSVVYGNDCVPRLGIRTIEKLKYTILDTIKECKTPKHQILLGGITLLTGKRPSTYSDSKSEPAPVIDEPARRQSKSHLLPSDVVSLDIDSNMLKKDACDINETYQDVDLNGDGNRMWLPCGELLPPGKMIYITETRDFRRGHSKKGYTGSSRWRMRWADRSEFNEIIIHERMVLDHMPFRLQKALQVIAETNISVGPMPSSIAASCKTQLTQK